MKTITNQKVTRVSYTAKPFGRNHQNPPNLEQLREFVKECEGLPGETPVTIQRGSLDEGGRHDYKFAVHIVEEDQETEEA